MSFNPQIGPNEEIKFIGSYDRKNVFAQQIPGYPGGNAGITVNISGVCSNSFISDNFVETKSGLLDSPIYVDATYSMVSYLKDNNVVKLGSLIWSGTFIDRSTIFGVAGPAVEQFVVLGGSGLYSNVNKVITDFNNDVRVIYFIGLKIV
jgi:hypothetical protein